MNLNKYRLNTWNRYMLKKHPLYGFMKTLEKLEFLTSRIDLSVGVFKRINRYKWKRYDK